MRNTPELAAALRRLARATKGLSADEQIAVIDAEIADPDNAPYRSDFEVHKAIVLGGYGHKREAARILKRCAAENDDNDEMQYFAGESSLETGDFSLAIGYLSRCIEIAESSSEPYYLDAAYLLRAYCAARSGQFDLARKDLAQIDDDDAMRWIDADPVVSKSSILDMLGEKTACPGMDTDDIDDDDDAAEDPPLTAAQQALVSGLSETQLNSIDAAIMQNLTNNWRKVALIIALAMRDNDSHLSGVIDLFYGQRIMRLVGLGLIESVGNLKRMGYSEVRLPQSGGKPERE